ncbi:uncharacterized protein LOC108931212 [Scleropages formosus]|uniref:uncharacterized protein LOC108931212 n=1 Tax=Scleropages formosus TaxID=113540 RepID=UPI0010FA81B3|nr:uncharacterized protein LOC108931212 [Scleropages formosus]
MPSHKDMPAGHKAPPTEGKAPASRDRCATNRSKATSGGAARGMLAPQRGFEPKTRSLGVKQRDPRSSRSAESAAQCRPRAAGAQKAEQRGARLVAPTSQLPRVSNTREQDGSRLQASRSGAPLLSYTGRGLVGSSVLPMARRKGPGKPASTRVPRAALGRSAPQPWGQAPDPGLRKGLCRVPLTGQGSASAGTRTTQVSATGGPKLTQTGSQRAG